MSDPVVDIEVEAPDEHVRERIRALGVGHLVDIDLDVTEETAPSFLTAMPTGPAKRLEATIEVVWPEDEIPGMDTSGGDSEWTEMEAEYSWYGEDATVSGEKISHEMKESDGPGTVGMSMEDDPHDEMTFTTHRFEVDEEIAKQTYESVVEAIEERRNDHFTIDHIVLGIPQYKALTAYINQNPYASDESVESFMGLEITVVPGPMIHPVIDNKRLLTENL